MVLRRPDSEDDERRAEMAEQMEAAMSPPPDSIPGIRRMVLDAQRRVTTRASGRAILLKELADSLDSGTIPVMNAAHARHNPDVIIAAQSSARTGRVVTVGQGSTDAPLRQIVA